MGYEREDSAGDKREHMVAARQADIGERPELGSRLWCEARARLRPAVGQTSVNAALIHNRLYGDEYAHPASWQLALLSSVQATAVLLFRPIVRVARRCLGLPVSRRRA